MRKLDILVHASTIGEPFGQVIVQAMAAGKPVVATNGGGVPEIVIHGITGFLVPMADATAMSSAIAHFWILRKRLLPWGAPAECAFSSTSRSKRAREK